MFSGPEDAGEVVSSGALPATVALFIGALNLLWTWWSRSQTAAADRVQKMEDRIDMLEDRQSRLEEGFKHLPTKDDISALSLKVEQVLGKVGSQENEISKIDRVVNRIDDWLREKA